MRLRAFSIRTAKEIFRDPLTVAFGLGFPIVLLLLLSAIQANIPAENDLFEIDSLTPGITVFGLSFITLFSGTLVSRDRESAFLQRLYATPMTAADFVLGYLLPLFPMVLAQGLATYAAALFLKLSLTPNILLALLFLLPVSLLFISLGLLFGSILNVKQLGGVCGALLTNLSAWLSGVWFDISLVGGAFETIAECLPFLHEVKLEQAVLAGNFEAILPHLAVVLGYGIAALCLAVLLFLRQMKRQ